MIDAARLVFPSLRWRQSTGFAHEREKIDRTLELGAGGYIIFGGTAGEVRRLITDLQSASGHLLLIASDLERGAAQQFDGLTHLPPAAALGFVNQPELTRRCGNVTAVEGRSVGVNWVYAPVADLDIEADNPIVQTRSFGDSAPAVSRHVRAWIEGAMAGGVMATAKHFPGHGRTTLDSHEVLPDVQLDLEQLFDTDLMPFRAAIAAGVGAVMTAHVAFPQWDGSGMPATLSPTILSFLRDELGFTGLVVTDALIMEGALNGRHESDVSVDALRAGCDALLYPRDPVGLIYAIDRAAAAATFAIEASVERVTAAAVQSRPMDDFVGAADRAEFAAALADLALHTLRDGPLVLEDTITVSVVDDDVGGPYRVGPRDLFERTLRARGVASGRGSKITLIFSEPRSWKGRAGFGESTIAALGREIPGSDLVLLFGPPRLATAIPGDMPVVCAWHGQPLMQEAAARWVLDRLR